MTEAFRITNSYCTTELHATSSSYSKHCSFTSIQGRIKQRKVRLLKAKENTKNVIYVRYFLKYEQELSTQMSNKIGLERTEQ